MQKMFLRPQPIGRFVPIILLLVVCFGSVKELFIPSEIDLVSKPICSAKSASEKNHFHKLETVILQETYIQISSYVITLLRSCETLTL